MNFNKKHIIYFIGIGGIGMSALANYFIRQGKKIAGYDRTPSEITQKLSQLGADIHYDEEINGIPNIVLNASREDVLIIYTPAISQKSSLLQFFFQKGFDVSKRAEILGNICNPYPTIAIAGTHGKTTITSLVAHIINLSEKKCLAFLGGIAKNYDSNFIFSGNPAFAVAEADEYDRSFMQLNPMAAIITSVDPDHLDIYKTYDAVKIAFNDFANKISFNGKLLLKKETSFIPSNPNIEIEFYSTQIKAACFIANVSLENGYFTLDIHTPWGNLVNVKPGITGDYNIENVLAASSLCLWLGIDNDMVKQGVETFTGVRRRFDVQLHNANHIYIDDYAHHPEEIKAFITSVKTVFPNQYITGIFQPHLYSRTRDLATEFAQALSLLDELWLMNIYPARELPIEGVTSEIIFKNVACAQKRIIEDEEIPSLVKSAKPGLILTMGAGNIDKWINPIKESLYEA
jgi:UDP-N-acetylmuramate--alanine ligase